jgi:hypothetical protein
VPPLISQEEALRLGQIEDHAEIEALVERAWRVRLERFGDSTDMCSLVNARSGGCAEDCGFCAQSRFACGGRNENLGTGEFQKLAVRAGLNGVMMGNFLTTLGSEPEWDRQMFGELGLNVGRHEDNGANPRPDNRSGWLEGDSPRTPLDEPVDSRDEADLWNLAVQLRHRKKSSVPARPDGASNTSPEVVHIEAREPSMPRTQARRLGGPSREPRTPAGESTRGSEAA